jgi:hypothetical protein
VGNGSNKPKKVRTVPAEFTGDRNLHIVKVLVDGFSSYLIERKRAGGAVALPALF